MHSLRNRRTVRALALGVASGLLFLVPARAMAQDSTTVPKTHIVKKGDTLWDLAAKYLADAFRWPEIYRLNTDVIQDPHWIYPGELLKLPGYVDVSNPSLVDLPGARVTPGQVQPPTPPSIPLQPSLPDQPTGLRRKADSTSGKVNPLGGNPPSVQTADTSARMASTGRAVPYGDFLSAPWVDRRQGPPVWGRILGSADIPGIDPAKQQARFQMMDQVLIAPPAGSVAPEHELYLAYHYGPLIEDIGQVIIPTGVLEVNRSPRNGEAAVASIVQMFGEVQERDRLMPYDSSGLTAVGSPTPVKNGIEGKVRWVQDDPVLSTLPSFIVLSYTSKDGVKIGDRVELFQGSKKAADEGLLGTPEVHIGFAQIVRVTPFATTAVVTRVDQPKVSKGTMVRVTAKMQ